MLPSVLVEQNGVTVARKLLPDVAIVLPFEPKITGRPEIDRRLEHAEFKVALEVSRNYSREESYPLLSRLRKLINTLNFSTFKKSIAIFLSDAGDHVYYLDIDVAERVVVGEPFDMHRLVNEKRESQRCLLLVLSSEKMKIFEATPTHLMRVMHKIPASVDSYRNDLPERVSNFTDPATRKETLLDKFLHHADVALSSILKTENVPVFILATEKTAGHFMKITRNGKHVAGQVHGNYEDAPEYVLLDAITPELDRWDRVKQQHLLTRLDIATGAGRVATGIRAVSREAAMRRGQLLVVERNYTYPTSMLQQQSASDRFFIKDAVDRVIADVLESGGDVEFVDEGALNGYRKIALIKYY